MRRVGAILAVLVLMSCGTEPRLVREELVVVPDVSGRRVAEAREELFELGFGVQVFEEEGDAEVDCPAGTVLTQDPPGGEEVLTASTVVLAARGC